MSRAEVLAALKGLGLPADPAAVSIGRESITVTVHVRGMGGHVLDDPNRPGMPWTATSTVPIIDEPDPEDVDIRPVPCPAKLDTATYWSAQGFNELHTAPCRYTEGHEQRHETFDGVQFENGDRLNERGTVVGPVEPPEPSQCAATLYPPSGGRCIKYSGHDDRHETASGVLWGAQ